VPEEYALRKQILPAAILRFARTDAQLTSYRQKIILKFLSGLVERCGGTKTEN
jgi:hypothetical protein